MTRVRNVSNAPLEGIAPNAEGDVEPSNRYLASGELVAVGAGKPTLPPRSASQSNMPAMDPGAPGAPFGAPKPNTPAPAGTPAAPQPPTAAPGQDPHAAHGDQPRQPDGLFPPGQSPADDNMGNDTRPPADAPAKK